MRQERPSRWTYPRTEPPASARSGPPRRHPRTPTCPPAHPRPRPVSAAAPARPCRARRGSAHPPPARTPRRISSTRRRRRRCAAAFRLLLARTATPLRVPARPVRAHGRRRAAARPAPLPLAVLVVIVIVIVIVIGIFIVVVVALVQRVDTGIDRPRARSGTHVGLVRMRAELFGPGAAPRAGKGAVEAPSARVAVVHDAGRLSSSQVTFIVTAVKLMWNDLFRRAPHPVRTIARATSRGIQLQIRRLIVPFDPFQHTPLGPRPYCHASISNV